MGIWPFGRKTADVELVTRIVSASCIDGTRVRGKLTIHFELATTEPLAEQAADTCTGIVEALLGESSSAQVALGTESAIATQARERVPEELPSIRQIEVAALHIVAGVTIPPSSALASSPTANMSKPAAPTPFARPASTATAATKPTGATPPIRPAAARTNDAPAGTSKLNAGAETPPNGQPGALHLRDAAARLLLALLRAHDAVTRKRQPIDVNAADALGKILPKLDAPTGMYELGCSSEVERWSEDLGKSVVDALRYETTVIATFLAYTSLTKLGETQANATALTQALANSAFDGRKSPLVELGRYMLPVEPTLAEEVSARFGTLVTTDPVEPFTTLTSRILDAIGSDLGAAPLRT